MPQPQSGLKRILSTAAVLPTSKYPHLRKVVRELIFKCPSCTSGHNRPVYWTWEEAVKDPLSGPSVPGKPSVTPKGMIATRFAVFCPDCGVKMGGSYVDASGIIDLLSVPQDFKRPPMPAEDTGDSVSFDDGDGAAVKMPATEKATSPFGKGKKSKKKSDLNPKTKAETAKEKAKAVPPQAQG